MNALKVALVLLVSELLWFLGLMYLRYESFNPDGSRKKEIIEPNAEIRAAQIKSHSEGLYRDVDLFLKISLAIFGGIAFMAITKSIDTPLDVTQKFIGLGFNLQLYTAIFTALFIFIHKRSVVLRWPRRYNWWEVFLWGETWGVFFGLLFSYYAYFVVQSDILKMLQRLR